MHASMLAAMPSKPLAINVVQSSNPKGDQKFYGQKEGHGKKKGKEGKRNVNNPNNDIEEGKKDSKKKVKFPWKLCNGDHITHLFHNIEDAWCFLAQQGS